MNPEKFTLSIPWNDREVAEDLERNEGEEVTLFLGGLKGRTTALVVAGGRLGAISAPESASSMLVDIITAPASTELELNVPELQWLYAALSDYLPRVGAMHVVDNTPEKQILTTLKSRVGAALNEVTK